MLPTEDKTNIRYNSSLKLYSSEISDYGVDNNDYIFCQHIYITVPQEVEPIKEGDWGYDTIDNAIFQMNNQSGIDLSRKVVRKIIATTDSLLIKDDGYTDHIPQVPQSFIKEYCKNPDGKWCVDYKKELDSILLNRRNSITPKLNQDNTVTIHPLGDKVYSREDMILFGEHILRLTNNAVKKHHQEKSFKKLKMLDEITGPKLVRDLLADWT